MNFDPSGDNRETQNGMSSVRRPDTRNLDMLAAVSQRDHHQEEEAAAQTMATLPSGGHHSESHTLGGGFAYEFDAEFWCLR